MPRTAKRLIACASVVTLLSAGQCTGTKSYTETEREVCRQWGQTLFQPSRADTPLTAGGLQRGTNVHSAVCPGIPQNTGEPFGVRIEG